MAVELALHKRSSQYKILHALLVCSPLIVRSRVVTSNCHQTVFAQVTFWHFSNFSSHRKWRPYYIPDLAPYRETLPKLSYQAPVQPGFFKSSTKSTFSVRTPASSEAIVCSPRACVELPHILQ